MFGPNPPCMDYSFKKKLWNTDVRKPYGDIWGCIRIGMPQSFCFTHYLKDISFLELRFWDTAIWKAFENRMKTVWKPYENRMKTVWKPYEDRMHVWKPYEDRMKTVWRPYENRMKTVWKTRIYKSWTPWHANNCPFSKNLLDIVPFCRPVSTHSESCRWTAPEFEPGGSKFSGISTQSQEDMPLVTEAYCTLGMTWQGLVQTYINETYICKWNKIRTGPHSTPLSSEALPSMAINISLSQCVAPIPFAQFQFPSSKPVNLRWIRPHPCSLWSFRTIFPHPKWYTPYLSNLTQLVACCWSHVYKNIMFFWFEI